MQKFFSSILKQKKIIFSLLLLFIFVGILLPTTTHASTLGDVRDAARSIVSTVSSIPDQITYIPLKLVAMSYATTALIFNYFCYFIAWAASQLFLAVLKQLINNPDLSITKNAVYLANWNTVKGYANMALVLAVIAVAIAVILKLKEEGAKKLLIPLLTMALLINFSNVFVGLGIDASNMIMKNFTSGADQGAKLIDKIVEIEKRTDEKLAVPDIIDISSIAEAFTHVQLSLMFGAIYLIVGLTLLYITILLMIRYVILVILFIVSPLVFVLRILPFNETKKIWDTWWQTFIEWCFVGILAAFFLRLSITMLFDSTLGVNALPDSGLESVYAIGDLFLRVFIPMLFLIVGLRIASKAGGKIAQGVRGVAKGVAVGAIGAATLNPLLVGVGLAVASKAAQGKKASVVGTTIGMGKAAAEIGVGAATGNIAAVGAGLKGAVGEFKGQSAQMGSATKKMLGEAATPIGEKLGVLPKGSTLSAEEQRKEENMRKYREPASQVDVNEGRKMVLNATRRGGLMSMDEAAQTERLAGLGLLEGTTAEKAKALDMAGEHLGRNSRAKMWAGAEKKDADLADLNTEKHEEISKIKGISIDEARALHVRNSYQPMDAELSSMSERDKIAYLEEELARVDAEGDSARTAKGAKIFDEAVKDEYLHKAGLTDDQKGNTTNYNEEHYGSNARKALVKQDIRQKAYDDEAVNNLLAEQGIAANPEMEKLILDSGRVSKNATTSDIQKARKEVVTRAAGKLGTDKVAELDPSVFDGPLGQAVFDGLTKEGIKRALVKGSKELKGKIVDKIISDVDELGNLDIDLENLALIPKEEMEDAIKRAPEKIQKELKDKFRERAVATPVTRPAEKKDIDAAEATRDKDIEDLRRDGYMLSEGEIDSHNDQRETFGLPPTTNDEFYQQAIDKKNLDIIKKIQRDNVAKTDPKKQAEDIRKLREEGFMMTEKEKLDKIDAGYDPSTLTIDKLYEQALVKKIAHETAKAKTESVKPIIIPSTTDRIPLSKSEEEEEQIKGQTEEFKKMIEKRKKLQEELKKNPQNETLKEELASIDKFLEDVKNLP